MRESYLSRSPFTVPWTKVTFKRASRMSHKVKSAPQPFATSFYFGVLAQARNRVSRQRKSSAKYSA